mgnify:CR=1 FL=1|tara:strand:+ start:1379 stop:1630 length:252 start_codon:yes stop_codon:yes gene_type:complete
MKHKKEDDIEELKKSLHQEETRDNYDAKIFYDGKQYNMRIPAKVAKIMVVDPKRNYIRFTIVKPATIKEKPRLEISLESKSGS